MSDISTKIRRNLRRPLPDLWSYLTAKLVSRLWARHLQRVGRGFNVGRGALIQGAASISIGDRFFAGPGLWMEAVRTYREQAYSPSIEIGSDVTCSHYVHIAATTRVVLHDGVLLGSRVHITDHSHGVYQGDAQDSPDVPPAHRKLATGRPVEIGRNVWLGDGVVVLPGVIIGAGSIVGANSIVSRSLPAGVIAVGSPAVPIKFYDAESRRWLPMAEQS